MTGRSYNQKCEKCGEVFVTSVTESKKMCEKCILIQKVKEKITQLITKHPYMAYGREMLVLLNDIKDKIAIHETEYNKLSKIFEDDLKQIESLNKKCHYQI